MKNYYEILEVNPRASEEVIKKAHQVICRSRKRKGRRKDKKYK